jgi:hypothetical protein
LSAPRPRRALDRLLLAAAIAWLAAVALIEVVDPGLDPADVGSSPDAVAAGRLWRLLTSALIVEAGVPWLQIAVLAAVTALVLVLHGPIVWWLAALIGHVGSALLAYALIAVADALGSASAERVEDDWDYGISCVLAAVCGVLFAGGMSRLRRGRGGGLDVALVVATSLGLVGWLVTIDWYGVEHLFAFALGAGVVTVSAPAGRGSRRARVAG